MSQQFLPPSSSGKKPNWSGVVGYNPPPVQIHNVAQNERPSQNENSRNISAKSNTNNANSTNVNQPKHDHTQPSDDFDIKLSRLSTMPLANVNDALYPCGLSNPENKCFMNVVLQCLLASSAFLRVLISFQADAQFPANRCPYTTRLLTVLSEYQKNSGIRETKSQTTYISNQQPQLTASPSQSTKPSYQATESKLSPTQSTSTQSNQPTSSKKPSYSSTQQQSQSTQPQKYQPPPQVNKQNPRQQKTQSQQQPKQSQPASHSQPSTNNNGSHVNSSSSNTNSNVSTSKPSTSSQPESTSALPKILSFSSFTATAFISCLREFYTSGVDLQEDAQEYLNFLLSKFDVELKSSVPTQNAPIQPNDGEGDQWITKGKKKDVVNLTESFIKTTSTDPSVVTKIFGGQLQSVVSKKGGLDSSSSEPYFCIHLDVIHESISSLESALSFYSEKENVEYYNAQHRKVMATKQTKIEKLSNVLIFHFKRFTGVDDKINKAITFPEILSLHPNWCSSAEMSSNNRSQFELYAVILHHGKETRGGHYTCFTYNATYQSWFNFDDRSVTKSDIKRVLSSKDAYLLFYRRRNQ